MNKTVVAITGGPSGGKTTLIEALQKDLAGKVTVVPEAASILYRGGFPRKSTEVARRHTQRAIYATQKELETMIRSESKTSTLVCDRGSLDSIAYWPGHELEFFESLGSNRNLELARYDWVLHLDTAAVENFDTTNPFRPENHREALDLNEKIKVAWSGHPRRLIIPHQDEFLIKIAVAKKLIQKIMNGGSFDEVAALL